MNDFLWWRDGIIYQIYPRSFADSNGDGLGDLAGITARLDYLAELGVDAIWLSPIYPSPDKDFGYDVSDYGDVDPRFGSLADFDVLVREAHQRGIRVILDMVLNHTSDQHPWFQESRRSRDNPKQDWYLWKDPRPEGGRGVGRPPNNWQSCFGGRAWTYVPERGQYYYHMFLPEQPDVNWRNPAVRQAMFDVFRFWLERGVDGFRLDVFNVYFKDAAYRDNPPRWGLRGFDRQQHTYDCDQPEMFPLLRELRALLDSYPERYAVGETFLATPEKAASYCGADKLHAAFNFEFTACPFRADRFLRAIQRWETAVGDRVWPTYVLSNHDLPRSATRYARGEDDARAKVVLGLLLTLRGTPFLYYGEEIGMRDIHLRRSEILDPPGRRYWPFYKGRDGCRSPMQWDDRPYAGFSTSRPWLPVHPNYRQRNVLAQREDEDSLLTFTRRLIALRREKVALRRGDFHLVSEARQPGLAYLRTYGEQTLLIGLNFSSRPLDLSVNSHLLPATTWQILFSSHAASTASFKAGKLHLAPDEVCILSP